MLRSPVVANPDARWWAKVRVVSDDMEGEVQNYGFHFGGLCDRTGSKCPPLSDLVDSGEYENGWTSAVFGSNTNKRGEPQTCRCTVSSKPSCPDHVDMGPDPRPAAHIFIKDL